MYQDIIMKLSQQQHPGAPGALGGGLGGSRPGPNNAANLLAAAGANGALHNPNILHQVNVINICTFLQKKTQLLI